MICEDSVGILSGFCKNLKGFCGDSQGGPVKTMSGSCQGSVGNVRGFCTESLKYNFMLQLIYGFCKDSVGMLHL